MNEGQGVEIYSEKKRRKKKVISQKINEKKKKNTFWSISMCLHLGTERVKGDVWKRRHLQCGVEKKERDIDRGLYCRWRERCGRKE